MKIKSNLLVKGVALLCAFLMALGLFAGCNAECKHNYVDGVCSICESVCPHKEYGADGKCKTCGVACKHEYNKKGECKICAIKCGHEEYENGVCVECGAVCVHAEYLNGICRECGVKCSHHYTDGVCDECKTVCSHAEYVEGVCKECGTPCRHAEYAEGVCKECGTPCTHEYEGNRCKRCGIEKLPEPGGDDGKEEEIKGLSRIDINSNGTFLADAERYVPSYDNDNAANNIDWQYHDCTVTVSNCKTEYALEKTAGIKVRGNWTTTYPKKPFRIKFDKKQPMLGLNGGAKCKSWVLLADYKDCSLERNSVAFYLGQQILGADGYYCSDFRQVELYLDGRYWGVYLLAEQQQVNENRIDITEPAEPPAEGAEPNKDYLNTDIGYFIEYDGYYNLEVYNERFSLNYASLGGLRTKDGGTTNAGTNGFAIKSDVYADEDYKDPNANSWNPLRYPQKIFIRDYMLKLYTICYKAVYNHEYLQFNDDFSALVPFTPKTANPVKETVSKVIDLQSLVDTYILNEIACDADLSWSSFFMDVDFGPLAKDNLLRFEAPWDFDSALGFKANTCESGTGLFAANSSNPWLIIFINEDWFWNMAKDRWQRMKTDNVQKNTLQFINDLRDNNSVEYQRNFDKWGFVINGEAKWEIQNTVHNQRDAANQLYNWLNVRFNYLDTRFAM